MKVLAIQSSNRPDGLTASLAQAVLDGATDEARERCLGVETEIIDLNTKSINVCKACGERGWGRCWGGEPCVQQDDFGPLVEKIIAADAIVFATPVYFWDLSESLKTFLDRLRRAEWARRETARFKGKHVVGIAAAGGSGTGAPNAIRNLEGYMTYLGANHVAYLPVTRQNQIFQLDAAKMAGRHLLRVMHGI